MTTIALELTATIVNRRRGDSAVGVASNRSGQGLTDLRNNSLFCATNFQPEYSAIISPVADEWTRDRQQLWNQVEASEQREDSTLIREIEVGIPPLLDRGAQIQLLGEFVESSFIDRGMIADINLYVTPARTYASILLTTRNLIPDIDGKYYFGLKNTDWNHKNLLIEWRRNWAQAIERAVTRSGVNVTQLKIVPYRKEPEISGELKERLDDIKTRMGELQGDLALVLSELH